MTDSPAARQLRMARFQAHKNAIHKYLLKMRHWGATEAVAREEYRRTMADFDNLMELAVTEPERMEAIEVDMARGFYLPESQE